MCSSSRTRKNTMENKFGETLKGYRLSKGFTVRGFSKAVGISPTFLCDLESGARSFPGKSKFPNLCEDMIRALNLSKEEAEEFSSLASNSMLQSNRISPEMSEYLKSAPMAQQALRKARDNNWTDKDWADFMSSIGKKGK
jgi:transcriptional regulator with XRE-family HTH domain